MDILDTSKKSNYRKMLDGEVYTGFDEELIELASAQRRRMEAFLADPGTDWPSRMSRISGMVGEMGELVYVTPPFFFDYGIHIRLGNRVYINFGSTFLDSAWITLGDSTMVGPNVQFITASHPVKPEERKVETPGAPGIPFRPVNIAKPITIGRDCWIGAGAIILPGVTIGNGTTIGAGSVVTKPIPSRVVAAGNPARVIRSVDA